MNLMKIIRLFLISFVVCITSILKGQNIVQNGDFELYNKQTVYFLFNNLKYWYKPTWSSTDYQTSIYRWSWNKTQAQSGDAYMGIVVAAGWDYSEYGTNKLSKVLAKDSMYCLSLYVCLGNESTGSIYGVDALFTSKRIKVFTKKSLANKYKSDTKLGDSYITNKKVWIKLSGIYKAKGGEEYLTIGNFTKSDSVIFPELLKKSKIYTGYLLIDNVSLISIHDTAECDCNIKRINLETIQNDSLTKDEKNKIIAKEGTIISLKNLYFDNDSYIIKAESNEELDRLYNLLLSNPEIKIKINGYTDNVGNEKHNQWLSEQRTKSVVDYLIQKGISKERLTFTGYGSDNPIATNETEEGRAANRRVEVEFEK